MNVTCCCCEFDSHIGCWSTSAGISHKPRSNQIQCLGHCWSREIRWSARWILHPGWVNLHGCLLAAVIHTVYHGVVSSVFTLFDEFMKLNASCITACCLPVTKVRVKVVYSC